MITAAEYSRSQTQDVRLALATALQTFLKAQRFPAPEGAPLAFSQVFCEWPGWSDEYVANSAVVLPAGPGVYADALPTPTLLEDTWEPAGQAGLGLYKLSEYEVTFDVRMRSPSVAERAVLLAGVEQLFVVAPVLMDHVTGRRNGILLPLPGYWGLAARFTLQSSRVEDDEDSAAREHREAVVTVTAQTSHVKLGPVQPFIARIIVDPDRIIGGG